MEDQNSDDWLPPGWTVEVRVRKNGKRDKYYFAPSSGLKFNSRVEVFRHLDNAQNKVSIQRISDNVVVEKGIAEELPPGWMKKTRITTKGDTIRRDSYYIDPVSGYAFRSLKDVDRYLESGEIGRNAFKSKDSSDMVLKTDKFSSAAVTSKPAFSVSTGPSSDLDMIANDQQIPNPACSVENMPMPISEHISSQCVAGTALTSSVLLRGEGPDPKEVKGGLAESTLVSGFTKEDAQEKQLQENAQTKLGTEKAQNRQCKKHKEINLPRRASKRLAGIKVDPVPELLTRSRARRVVVKQSGEGETITNEDKSQNSLPDGAAKQINTLEGGSETKCISDSATNTAKSGQSKHLYEKLSTPEKLHDKTVEEHGSNKDHECFPFLPPEKHATVTDTVRIFENGDKVDAKLDYSLDFPLGEILTDPCIAFAIQTLTGVTFETSNNSQIPSELKNSAHSETSAAAKGHGTKNIEGPNMHNDKEGCNVFSAPENFTIPVQEHAGGSEIDYKANENTKGSSSEKALDISWMDPCIEFAIKTLTDTIPLDPDQNPKNCLQQQQHSKMALSSFSVENLYQNDYCCSQYVGTQQPMFKQQSFVDPTLQQTRNVGIGNSAGARLPHCEDRRNIWQR